MNGRPLVWCALAALALLSTTCDRYPERPSRDREYHQHRLIFYYKVIGGEADTIGIVSGNLELTTLLTGSRPDVWPIDDFANLAGTGCTFMLPAPAFDLAPPDTEFHACTTYVDHYIGYQLKYGGDTTRICAFDRYDGWEASVGFIPCRAALRSGDTLTISTMTWHGFPDTVRADRDIEIELVFNLRDVLSRVPNPRYLLLDVNRIEVHER